MKKHSNRPFSNLSEALAPEGLEARVKAHIATTRAQSLKIRHRSLGVAAIASAVAFLAACAYTWNALVTSGFSGYASLVLSDGTRALSYSKELGLSLVESLPALALAVSLAAFLAFAWSLSGYFGGRRSVQAA